MYRTWKCAVAESYAGRTKNAVVPSFLEPSDFAGAHGAAARDLLPDRLRALIHEAV